MNPERKKRRDVTRCGSCGAALVNVLFFCLTCWQLLPGKERASLYAMHNRGQDTDSKVMKCVRILKEKRTREANTQ